MTGETGSEQRRMDATRLLFEPRSIAIVGASTVESSIGGRPIRYLKKFGFSGTIYPVNPKQKRIGDLQCFPSLTAIGAPVDLVILAVSAKLVPDILTECAAIGAVTVIIFSGGYAESGDEGRAKQEEIYQLSQKLGLCLLGPNSMGAMNLNNGAMATFSAVLEKSHAAGALSFVSQSGAYGAYIMAQARDHKLGFNLFASTGNEADLKFSEILRYMIEDTGTRAVFGYIEQLRDAEAFIDAARAGLAMAKPVVVLKVGRSESGARAAHSHTGAMAGTHKAYEAVFRQTGVIQTNTVDEMLDIARLLQHQVKPRGNRVGILSISGGAGVLLADAAEEAGMEVPALPVELQQSLHAMVPFAAVANPIDFTPQILNDPSVYGRFLGAMVNSPEIDALFVFMAHTMQYEEALGLRVVAETAAATQYGKPIIMVGMPGDDGPVGKALQDARIPYFEDPARAVRAMASLMKYGRDRKELLETAASMSGGPIPFQDTRGEVKAKRFVSQCGIDIPREATATNEQEAVDVARSIGEVVVMKVDCPDLDHKSEYGGVKLHLKGDAAIASAFSEIISSVSQKRPDKAIEGVVIQEMIHDGVEVIVGMNRDAVFGPMILCGLGGIFAEILNDFALARAPVSEAEAWRMIRGLRGFSILDGARGRPKCDLEALVATIVRCSQIALGAEWIEEFDINPLVVRPVGHGCVAVDVLIKVRQ